MVRERSPVIPGSIPGHPCQLGAAPRTTPGKGKKSTGLEGAQQVLGLSGARRCGVSSRSVHAAALWTNDCCHKPLRLGVLC